MAQLQLAISIGTLPIRQLNEATVSIDKWGASSLSFRFQRIPFFPRLLSLLAVTVLLSRSFLASRVYPSTCYNLLYNLYLSQPIIEFLLNNYMIHTYTYATPRCLVFLPLFLFLIFQRSQCFVNLIYIRERGSLIDRAMQSPHTRSGMC